MGDFFADVCRLPQHRNANERVLDEKYEFRGRVEVEIVLLSCSTSNGSTAPGNTSDDDDDRVIEMTGGENLVATLVIDFYATNENESTVSIHTGNDRTDVAGCCCCC